MNLDELTLQNFRSYGKKTVAFSPETTLIVGPNTAGKTNILEAIMFCATGKSFRADMDREAVRWGSEMSNVKCQMSNREDQIQLELYITQGEVQGAHAPLKKYLVNGVPRRQVDFVGNLRAVLFWPEHLELVTDSPSLRRRYLDSVLVQVDREYRRSLLSYERGLRQRNRLLDFINEGKANRRQLLFWDQLLIKAGGYITDKRGEYIDYVNTQAISDKKIRDKKERNFSLSYGKSVISEARLEQYAEEEVAAKATLVGPHRDDFTIEKVISDKQKVIRKAGDSSFLSPIASHLSLSAYGSRGEQRLAVLWLKLAELAYIEREAQERPILLLDDIFSELDESHRELVVGLIGKQQTILTSADRDIMGLIPKNAKFIEL
ncbi:DNA replication and repair protein RecF [Candidatus Gottesmanbacteria bacterium]|nr:DNA replication and repair protein RecF [Candidatus Gottesmanbacteria bacterium]